MKTPYLLILLGFLVSAQAASYETPQRCLKPPAVGPCKAKHGMWYYDPSKKACKGFIYGGCKGNSNRFGSEVKCQQTCLPGAPLKPVCSLKPAKGPCKARVFSWAYDSAADRCRLFVYGGCKGNANNFRNCIECMDRCSGKESKKAMKLCFKLTAREMKKYGIVRHPVVEGPE
uniref:Putative bilaris n=1 Tax=Amblyomma parvum TaxID=251391 RepID=A0A023FXT0_AMBPA